MRGLVGDPRYKAFPEEAEAARVTGSASLNASVRASAFGKFLTASMLSSVLTPCSGRVTQNDRSESLADD